MGITKFSFIFILPLFYSIANANYYCTSWTEQSRVTCIFAGRSAKVYERQCENPCWYSNNGNSNWGSHCDMEIICSPRPPNEFSGLCSDWVQESGVSCRNPNTDNFENKWVRACTVGLRTDWCSNERPPFH